MQDRQNEENSLASNMKLAEEVSLIAKKIITQSATHPDLTKKKQQQLQNKILTQRNKALELDISIRELFSIPNSFVIKLLKRNKKTLKKSHLGNCGEISEFVAILLRSKGVSCEILEIGDHEIVVIGRKEGSILASPETWGEEAVICDLLNHTSCYPAKDFSKFFKTYNHQKDKSKPNVYLPYTNETISLKIAVSVPVTKNDMYQADLVKQTINRLIIMCSVGSKYTEAPGLRTQLMDLIQEARRFVTNQKKDFEVEKELNNLIRQAHGVLKQYIPEEKIIPMKHALIQAIIKHIGQSQNVDEKTEFYGALFGSSCGKHSDNILCSPESNKVIHEAKRLLRGR